MIRIFFIICMRFKPFEIEYDTVLASKKIDAKTTFELVYRKDFRKHYYLIFGL